MINVVEIDLDAWAEGLNDGHLLCRDMGHMWRPFRAWWDEEANGYQRVLRCGRCKTERRQLLSSNGAAVSGYYSYADGYVAPKGTGRVTGETKNRLRLESTLRVIGKDERNG